MNKTILIYSGGLDSTVLLYKLLSEGHEVHCISFNYGQRHEKELIVAEKFCQELQVSRNTINLSQLGRFLPNNSQTDLSIKVPEGHYTEENMKKTVVPNRNMIMLSIASGIAIGQSCGYVAFAAHAGDHTIYPDCRPIFVKAFHKALADGNWEYPTVLSPFINMGKTEIVKLGETLKVPFHETWSCYNGLELHCGKCGTCVERKEAFELAGIPDLTIYEKEKTDV